MNRNRCDLTVICDMYKMPLDGEWKSEVVAYHLTKKSNVESIITNGLKAKECSATWYESYRQAAVYLLGCRADAYDLDVRRFLFDDPNDVAVLKITVPQSAFESMSEDGLFNVSCECSDGSMPFGIRYMGDIPASWITIE